MQFIRRWIIDQAVIDHRSLLRQPLDTAHLLGRAHVSCVLLLHCKNRRVPPVELCRCTWELLFFLCNGTPIFIILVAFSRTLKPVIPGFRIIFPCVLMSNFSNRRKKWQEVKLLFVPLNQLINWIYRIWTSAIASLVVIRRWSFSATERTCRRWLVA